MFAFVLLTNLTANFGLVTVGSFELGSAPTIRDAQAVADQLYAEFVSQDADKVEIIYSKFVSLINSQPTVQTMLPLTPQVSRSFLVACN